MDYSKKYRSKGEYSVRPVTNMGVQLVEVSNEYGMVAAILSENDFDSQFEVIPDAPVGETPTS